MKIRVNPHSDTPIYEQMVNTIIAAIEANQLGSGDRLPSIRGLSAQLGINPNTTARVYRELELRGFIESKTGSGCYVLPRSGEAAAREKAARMQQLYSDMLHEARERRIGEEDFLRFLRARTGT
ncbi:MAG TPA: GntR family transcriptional regulator [Steroidobacteraceae bacterium]|nr:GntR family transcriptional regulator [Steroidobacteraceae bacterium]